MRPLPNLLVERYRILDGKYRSTPAMGHNGYFLIPGNSVYLFCISGTGGSWDHVSVSPRLPDGRTPIPRCPDWAEMCEVKRLFWGDEETVMQLHPAKSDYVNYYAYSLHLWRPQTAEEVAAEKAQWLAAGEPWLDVPLAGPIPLPPSWMVGPGKEPVPQTTAG